MSAPSRRGGDAGARGRGLTGLRLVRSTLLGALVGSIVLVGVGVRLAELGLGWVESRQPAAPTRQGETPYNAPGPHGVGLREMTVGTSSLKGVVWYPADAGGRRSVAYPYGIKAFADAPFAVATYRGMATRDAAPDPAGGPYPLVILSPGFAFGATTYGWLAEHLASHGFVVLAMEHLEQLDPNRLWQATIDRPRDTTAALDHAEAAVRSGTWRTLVDPDHVAVVGHSYGGYTALAAAGARLDSTRLREICEGARSDDPIVFQCDALMPHIDEMANAAGLGAAPDGLWPAWGDRRVRAAVALAGDAVMFGETGVAEINVPVMAIGGTADVDAPYPWGTALAYEETASPRKVEIGLEGAEHMVFTGPCETRRRVLTVLAEPFCSDPAWDKATAHDLVRHYVTAFLLAEMRDDSSAAGTLAPGAVSFAKVHYAATGY